MIIILIYCVFLYRGVNHSSEILYTTPGNAIVFHLDVQKKSYYFTEINLLISIFSKESLAVSQTVPRALSTVRIVVDMTFWSILALLSWGMDSITCLLLETNLVRLKSTFSTNFFDYFYHFIASGAPYCWFAQIFQHKNYSKQYYDTFFSYVIMLKIW